MTWLFRISVGLLMVILALLAVWIATSLIYSPTSFSPTEFTPLFVAAGVLAALITFSKNQLREASEEYLENATDLLSKAYSILETNKDDKGRPKNSRLNWLTAARLIRTAESIADLVTVDSHRRIWREQEEYWRGRLRDLIRPENNDFPKEYYAAKPEHLLGYSNGDQIPLSERSLAVLYRFVQWPDDMEDPLKNDTSFTKEEIEKMALFGPKGLGELLEEKEQIKSKNK